MTCLLDDVAMIAFDLDGTLVDSAPDLARAVNAMLSSVGAQPLAVGAVIAMIGDGIDALVERALASAFGRPPASAEFAACLPLVIAHYGDCIVRHSHLYPGVMEALSGLRQRGMPLCCITNKFSQLTLPLIAAMRIDHFFAHVLCAETADERKPSPVLLERAFALCATAPRTVLMVGDSCDDILAARAAGCRVAAVSYGYSDAGRLLAAGADWLVDELHELTRIQVPGTARQPSRAVIEDHYFGGLPA